MDILEKAIGLISPRLAAERAFYRSPEVQAMLNPGSAQFSQQYRHLRMNSASDPLPSSNLLDSADLNESDWTGLRAEMRRLVASDGLAKAIIQTLVDNTVGPAGPSYQSKSGDKALDKDIEAWWNSVKDSLDCRGCMSFADLSAMVDFEALVAGDSVALPLADGTLQLIEAEQIENPPGVSDAKTCFGVELGKLGRPSAYYIGSYDLNSGSIVNHERFDASKVFFYGKLHRPSAVRGFPALFSALSNLRDLEDYLGAEKARAKFSALFGLQVSASEGADPAPPSLASALGSNLKGQALAASSSAPPQAPKMKMGQLANIVMPRGWRADPFEFKAPSPQMQSFVEHVSRFAGLGAGPIPLEFVLMDFSRSNFGNTRAAWLSAYKTFRRRQLGHGALWQKIFNWRYRYGIQKKEFKAPDAPPPGRWIYPGYQYFNPREEIAANGEALDRHMTTLQYILSGFGLDVDDVLDQRQYEVEGMRKRGLSIVTSQPGANMDGKAKEPAAKPQ